MKKSNFILILTFLGAMLVFSTGCTGQLPNAFRLQQQQETYDVNSKIDINTKIDLLWVVDNSASMDVSQEKLRNGFASFASKYMKPTWDIRVAVITTDTFLAHPAFADYLNTTIGGTTNWKSNYIWGRIGSWVNPSWNPSLVNPGNGRFTSGISYGDIWPLARGGNYSRLLPGVHDGPVAALCFEGHSYFYSGITNCRIRDDQTTYNGPSHCLNPNTGAGETSLTQCVNTVENDTIHSGKAIIETMPPAGTPADAAWESQLVDDFIVNVTTGSSGQGSERGLASVQQLLTDNEGTTTAFFRPGSLRGIIFVSDEEDQSVAIPASPGAGYTPFTSYTSACPSKTVDGFTYTLTTCPAAGSLVPVSDFKDSFDSFFTNLDGGNGAAPNYFVVSIVPTTGAAVQALQAARTADDTATGNAGNVAVDRGDRYLELGTLVGNGSMAMNIADSDYSPILDAIGASIVAKKSRFMLNHVPTAQEDMIVTVLHADGTSYVIPYDKYYIDGDSIVITDPAIVLGFSSTDKIIINYQPRSLT